MGLIKIFSCALLEKLFLTEMLVFEIPQTKKVPSTVILSKANNPGLLGSFGRKHKSLTYNHILQSKKHHNIFIIESFLWPFIVILTSLDVLALLAS
jgi:hypothetical protein